MSIRCFDGTPVMERKRRARPNLAPASWSAPVFSGAFRCGGISMCMRQSPHLAIQKRQKESRTPPRWREIRNTSPYCSANPSPSVEAPLTLLTRHSTLRPSMTPEKLQSTLKTIRQFVQEEVFPLEVDFIQRPFRELLPRLRQKREKVKAMGLWCPQLPESVGGLGLSLAEFGRVSEELGRTPMGHYLFNCQAPDAGNLEILIEHATPEQKETWLAPLVRGDIRSCFSMTEPEHAGSNPVWMSTTATKDGKDYVINGHKWFTSAADGAAFAIVMAITNPDAAKPHHRASQIIVPTNAPGFRLVRNIPVMGDEGEDYGSHAEIRYENCRVPQANLLGKEGDGFAIAQHRLGPGRIHHCMRWIGICERSFDLMCGYAAKRL